MTNLIIGIATSYNWDTLEPFVMSLRKSGYDGRCVLMIDDNASLRDKLSQHDIEWCTMQPLTEHPIVARFPIAADIVDASKDLQYVLCVDTKDLVFQYNPVAWLDEHLGDKELAIVSEGSLYKDNIGNKANVLSAFGQIVYNSIAEEQVLNAGVIAGRPVIVSQLLRDIYRLCGEDLRLKTSTPTYEDMLPDQTAMNILIRREGYWSKLLVAQAKDGFVFEGVFSKVHLQQDNADVKEGIVYPKGSTTPFAIFHQYFAWQAKVREKYRESN